MKNILLLLEAVIEVLKLVDRAANKKGISVTDVRVSDILADVKDLPLFMEGLNEASGGFDKIRKSFEQ